MEDDLSALVAASRLETVFLPWCVQHYFYNPQSPVATRHEIWDAQEEIGRGASGVVRKEQLRATQCEETQYAPYFVGIFGWFENDESIFIAMEYLPAGDLEQYRLDSGRFSESDTSCIVRQLVHGVRHMHENGFTHRDLKPGNILLSTTTPTWRIKIADFGISKQVLHGVTHQNTVNLFGTVGCAAPEALGYGSEDGVTITYTVSVDMWAVGVIALTLLLGRVVFPNPARYSDYVERRRPLDFSRDGDDELTELCRDFISKLLAPDPILRPTAIATLAHPWLRRAVTPSPGPNAMSYSPEPKIEYPSPAVDELGIKIEDGCHIKKRQPSRPDTKPEVKQETKAGLDLYPTKNEATIERIHTCLALDSILLSRRFRGLSFGKCGPRRVDFQPARNKILDKAFAQSMGNVVMFFSVILSRKFCGVARMTSPLDWVNTDPHWIEDVWQGRFMMEWLSHAVLSFDLVKHVPVKETTPRFRAIACYDGTEISRGSAWELLRAYSAEERLMGL
ncbi:kinase-like protein [Canariomyces notabilis]|uniref:Kinase-like protein n=1 Tax=Canariomyces notabilis TaxID=2074819 RepID=A0AAN6QEK3_9PEZI|nr:kinase-like protein [Canariomyces arenarius]